MISLRTENTMTWIVSQSDQIPVSACCPSINQIEKCIELLLDVYTFKYEKIFDYI